VTLAAERMGVSAWACSGLGDWQHVNVSLLHQASSGPGAETAHNNCCAGKVAVLSAKRLAPSLVPVLLYPGRRNAFIDWFEAQGGLAFQHRTSLLHRWQVRRS